MRRLLLTFGVMLIATCALVAQDPSISTTEYAELIVAPKASSFSVEVETEEMNPLIIDWGDGSPIETKAPIYTGARTRIKHTFKSGSDEPRIVKLDATHLLYIGTSYSEKNFCGIGTIMASKLETFDAGFNANFKDSKTDFSKCPKLKILRLNNLGSKAQLTSMPELTELSIESSLDFSTWEPTTYAQWEVLDLGLFPKLEKLRIVYQKIDKVIAPESGMPNLTSIELGLSNILQGKNLNTLTNSKKLVAVDLNGNYMTFEQLPQKNPEVTYTKPYGSPFNIQQYGAYLAPEVVQGRKVDLSYMSSIAPQFGTGDPVATKFVWYFGSSTDKELKPVPTEAYTIENGVTTFKDEAFAENEEEIKVFVSIENALFPAISYDSTNKGILYSNTLVIKKKEEPVQMAKLAVTIPDWFGGNGTVILSANGKQIGDPITKDTTIDIPYGKVTVKAIPDSQSVLYCIEDDFTTYLAKDLTLGEDGSGEITVDIQKPQKSVVASFEKKKSDTDGQILFQEEYEEGDIELMVYQKEDNGLQKLYNEDTVPVGTQLLLGARIKNGSYNLLAFKVAYKEDGTPTTERIPLNESDKDESGVYVKDFVAVAGTMTISLEYEAKTLASYKITVTQPKNGLIQLKDADGNDLEATDGAYDVKEEDVVYVKVFADEGYKVKSVTIGDKTYTAADGTLEVDDEGNAEVEYTVAGNVAISAVIEQSATMYKVTYSFPDEVADKVTVKVDGAAYASGTPVAKDKEVVFTYTKGNSKYAVESWTVDDAPVANTKDQDTYILKVTKDTKVGMVIYNGIDAIAAGHIAVRLTDNGTLLLISGVELNTPIAIYDLNGRELIATTSQRIDVSSLTEGVYVVRIAGASYRFIK